MGGKTVFMYFTIQSNIVIALISLIGFLFLLCDIDINSIWYVIKLVGTVSITLTGVVFVVVLAPTLGENAWNLQNVLTHVVVPIASVVDFFIVAPTTKMKKANVIYVIIPPLLYAIYAGVGYVRGWNFGYGNNYPYFFLNWGSKAGAFGFSKELPFVGCVWWIMILLIFLLIVGFCYVTISNRMRDNYLKRKGE
ncbi:MAG: hypothetical protein E7254_05925 [Lachnospiraceae bacterium]|nr:hypothetical protein [Lachnospiraceae bacterium]